MEEIVYEKAFGEDLKIVDCLTCNEIKELPGFAARRMCIECGEENFISPAS
jgi:hypothetical protein